MAVLFDLSDEITLIDQAPDHYGVEVEDFFYAVRTCGMLAAICSVFEAERIEKGVVISAYGKLCVHEIQVRESGNGGLISLGSQSLEKASHGAIERFFAGPADNPESWVGVIRHVFHHERAILQMVDFTGRLRSEWGEFLRVRKERLGF